MEFISLRTLFLKDGLEKFYEKFIREPKLELMALTEQVKPFLFKEDDIELVLKAPLYAERFLRGYE